MKIGRSGAGGDTPLMCIRELHETHLYGRADGGRITGFLAETQFKMIAVKKTAHGAEAILRLSIQEKQILYSPELCSPSRWPMLDPVFIGCDTSIYTEGGFPDHPSHRARLRFIPEIEIVTKLYAPATYSRRLDRGSLFAADGLLPLLQARFEWLGGAYAQAPGVSLVRLRGAIIRDRGLTIEHGGVNYPPFETYRDSDLLTLSLPGPCGPLVDLPDTHAYLLLTSSGSFNWGHWLTEDLPRLAAISAVAAREGAVCVLLHGFVPDTDRVRVALLRSLAGCNVTVRLLRPDTDYRASRLFFASPTSGQPGPKHPRALADLAEAGAALVARRDRHWWRARRRRPTRLFVTRRPARGRVPVGWRDLHDRLRIRGYTAFDPEGASGIEQVAAFASAERIVGCMGAAMVGSLFARPGTRVLYLAPDTFLDPYYLDLAAARGHAYGVCYGPARHRANPERSDYALDPDRLARALNWLETDE